MVDKSYLQEIKDRQAAYAAARREIIALAADMQQASKRAIFALHRNDVAGAQVLLASADEKIAAIRKLIVAVPDTSDVGSFRAALEEYAEAALYLQFVQEGKVGRLDVPEIDDEIYLGGLSDLAGELQRRVVALATGGKVEEVRLAKEAIGEIVEGLLAMDLGGYLRTKFDQAKNALRRAEDVMYDLSLREK